MTTLRTLSRGAALRRRIGLLNTLGPAGWLRFQIERRLSDGDRYDVRPRMLPHAVSMRRGTTDRQVFNQIFVKQEHAPLLAVADVDLVIDCGANVGYSCAWFLQAWPRARVIAVEPDPHNFAELERNLAPWRSRATVLHAAVWPTDARLTVYDGGYRGGGAWTRQVRVCQEGPGDVDGITIGALLDAAGDAARVIVKIDIEGAEKPLFEADTSWLERVEALAIELHDDSVFGRASDAFAKAIGGHDFEVSRSGELTICRRASAVVHER
jgi:FkbM family methyltransferase